MMVILPMLPESGIAVTLVKHHLTLAFSHAQCRLRIRKLPKAVKNKAIFFPV